MARQAPGFVLWRKADANRPVSYDGGAYGLVGMATGAMMAGPLERSIRQSRPYRCMVPRGHARYRTSEDVGPLRNGGSTAARAIMLRARIAASAVAQETVT